MRTTTTAKSKPRAAPSTKHRAEGAAVRPERIPTFPARKLDEAFDQPFAEGITDELDADLRHRLVSEVAFQRRSERASDDYDDEDWRDAEAAVDHVVVERPTDEK
jgi:hypothetical protein